MTNPSEGVTKPKVAPSVRAKLAKELNVSEHKVQQALRCSIVGSRPWKAFVYAGFTY
jgi:hypothetical protein